MGTKQETFLSLFVSICLMTVQRLVWCGLETGAVSRGLSKPILAIPYVFVLLQIIQLVMGD